MIEKLLTDIDLKKEEFNTRLPMESQFQKNLDDKFRLEWNYNSNKLEGNTLTYGETQILLFKGRATGEHEKRQYDEIEAHDLAIDLIRDWSQDSEREMTEVYLRELNKIILVKPFWKEAITRDGQSTRKKIIPGDYKTEPNSVRLKNGEIHHYPSPQETPALMNELFGWYNSNTKLHPVLKAANAHHRLTKIHPFDDGNGRVARLWLNYILLRSGYPPVIIRNENKEMYLTSLQKADFGDIEPFIRYLIQELNWSLDLSISAAKGEDINDRDDIDKEIALFDSDIKRLEKTHGQVSIKRSSDVILKILTKDVYHLIDLINKDLNRIMQWFNESRVGLVINNNEYAMLADVELDLIMNSMDTTFHAIRIEIKLVGFKNAGVNPFDIFTVLHIRFEQWRYSLNINNTDQDILVKTYSEKLTEDDLIRISDKTKEIIFREIKIETEKLKN